ncbi:MAG: hypothetical protein K6E42_10145 [Synergistes sp.]|nr:hypothetical protein [Synergistes sp.]
MKKEAEKMTINSDQVIKKLRRKVWKARVNAFISRIKGKKKEKEQKQNS